MNSLYPKLAYQNLKKNSREYLPYLGASSFMVFAFYIVCAILFTDGLNNIPYGEYLKFFMPIAAILMAIVSIPFLRYINSFLIRRRKKELGLYAILGLGKGNVGMVMLFESLYSLIFSLSAGLISGIVFGRLIFLALLRLVRLPIDFDFTFSPKSAFVTTILFSAIFLFNLLFNLVQVTVANPVSLMSAAKKGEKKSVLAPLYALIGFVCLGAGYIMSVTAKLDVNIILNFIFAACLVIIGTYGLFTAGSIYILKFLNGIKSLYYKPNNFVILSGMTHRMKKNAAGLVNICIFSTMLLVTLTCTISLYVGQKDLIELLLHPELWPSQGHAINLKGLSLDQDAAQMFSIWFGSFLFIGVFFAILFLICTVLVMYYKQITEGYEDQSRFAIMQNVGMDEDMVKSAVKKQILTLFFIPLIMAIVHTAFAMPMLTKLLSIFYITDVKTILLSAGGTTLIFALVYLAAYLLTARTYYKLVKR